MKGGNLQIVGNFIGIRLVAKPLHILPIFPAIMK